MARRQERRPSATSGPRSGRGRVLAAVAVVGLAIALAWATWRPQTARDPATSPVGAGGLTPPHFAPLVGNWQRPDGGYVLSVSAVAADGVATVSYFNPQPIRVARADARREDGHVGLFVLFDHPNYPGSTYTLAYEAATDTLKGIYYQAVQQARYDVEFVRQR